MEFGIYVNQYGDDRFEFGIDDMLEQVEFMEELGYDTAGVGERHFYEPGFYDPLSCMTAFAARTDSLRIFSNILILPAYHPIHLAERIVAMDHLTGGNTAFGVALGYRESELVNFGVPMDDRVSRFIETIEVTKRLLEGDRFDHDGDAFQFDDGFVRPEPVQDPRPPFWGGGGAPAAIKRAAYRCDGFAAQDPDPEQLESDIELYHETVEELGGDPAETTINIMVDGYVGETTEEAYDALDPYILDLYEQYNAWGNPEATSPRPSMDDIAGHLMVGTPAEVAERVAVYEDLGVDHLILRTQFGGMSQETTLDCIRRFGEDVIPEFQ